MNLGSEITVSVVVPCYNEQEIIEECHSRLTSVLRKIGDPYEIVFVNDGSNDNTPWLLRDLHTSDNHVTAVFLSRNFGHQHAVTAGLSAARGDAVVIIDADLQDPPEIIPEMIARWREGYDVVYGVRESREGESGFKLWSAKLFYRLISRLSDVKIPEDAGDFRLLSRKALNALLALPERHRLLRAMCSWVGYRQYPLKYRRAPRFAGATKYPLKKMFALALDGIVSFSTVPLRLVTLFGFFSAALSCIGILYSIVVRVFTHEWVRGWTTLLLGILFVGGVQMICLGILGEYIGRIYTEIKQRPLFLIDEILYHGTKRPDVVNSAQSRAFSVTV
jgi:glycosyltransferase involved in cell wall biosynthesis